MADEVKWGVVSTLKAPTRDVLNFAAYHLEQGAHRLYLYLDASDDPSYAHLKAHPKVRVTRTDDAYWQSKGKRPNKHQPRQTINAADAYAKRVEVDWLTHIDHDEFLVSDVSISARLARLSPKCLCARVRPLEALETQTPSARKQPFKSFALPMPERRQITQALYPTYGNQLNGGFLSHVAGKMIYRTGLEGFSVKIHNAFLKDEQNPGQQEIPEIQLCHLHADTYEKWRAHYAYRKSKGAYRAELKAPFDRNKGGINLHSLLNGIEKTEGEQGLRAFYTEVCSARDDLLAGLETHGLLHWHDLDLDTSRAKHFPDAL